MDSGAERYCLPTKLDPAPFGTIWVYIGKEDKQYFIQTAQEGEMPCWKSWGEFLGYALEEFIEIPEFKEVCLHLYEKKKHNFSEKIMAMLLKK